MIKNPLPKIRLTPTLLDAATIAVGIVCVSVAAGAVDWRAGLATFGGLLLGAEFTASAFSRGRE